MLDSKTWKTRAQLASAIFEWVECRYNPRRRHSSIGMLSPVYYEAAHTARPRSLTPHRQCPALGGQAHAP
ncbi:IS3 family transposase [Pseudonocardia aurantiaca]|uniref:IS3 family transposase n=1 Tax=Pseudonocardia aurantiaca TaxID=75290 RepID=UPI003A9730C7